MKRLGCLMLLGAALLVPTGCDDVLEDFALDLGYYASPGYYSPGPGGYYEETYVEEEYWYEETYYEDTWYVDDWGFWPW
jgi:hypothetical protein